METSNANKFEKFINDTFQDFEMAYNPNDWNDFEIRYDKALKKAKLFKRVKIFSISGGVIITALSLFFWQQNSLNLHTAEDKTYTQDIEIQNIKPISKIESSDNSKNEIFKPIVHEETTTINNEKNITDNSLLQQLEVKKEKTSANNEEINKINTEKNTIVSKPESAPENNIQIIHNLYIEPNKAIACIDEELRFSPNIINNNFTYAWDFNDGIFSNAVFPTHKFKRPGVFDIKLTVSDNDSDIEMVAYYSITINQLPDAQFKYNIIQEKFGYPQVAFIIEDSQNTRYKWVFGDGKYSYEQNPTHVYFTHENAKYNVSLHVENQFGCKNFTEQQIVFNDIFDLMAPNAFSPDGDGLNDYFMPRTLEIMDLNFEMFIYDRDGNMLYNTKNKSAPWDGRVGKNGFIPETGSFIWIVVIKDETGKSFKYAGNVAIVK